MFSAGCFDTPRHRLFFRHRSEGIFAVPSSEARFFEPQGSVLAGNMQRGWVFFLKLASCMAVFGGAWQCNSPIEGGNPGNRMIALSNPTKQIEMMWNRSVGSFVCFKSFREKVFPCMSQAIIGIFSLARIQKKTSEGHCRTPTVPQLSS